MDPAIVTLASSFGFGIVTAMASDAWKQARSGVVRVWGHFRPEAADAVQEDLDSCRNDVLSASEEVRDETQAAVAAMWQGQALALLRRSPEAAEEIRVLLRDLQDAMGGSQQGTQYSFTANVRGRGNVYQAGRDQRIG